MEINKRKKPRKPCLYGVLITLFVCLQASVGHALPYTARDLMSLCGFQGPCADTLVSGSAALANDAYLIWNNAAGSATINVLKVDANDETILNSDSGDGVHLQAQGDTQRWLNWTAASDTALVLSFGDGTASQTLSILGSTADAADTQIIQISPGNSTTMSASRGAYAIFEGNESNGRLTLAAGNVSTGSLTLTIEHASASIKFADETTGTLWSVTDAGVISQDATNGSDLQFNKGGTYVRMAVYVPTPVSTPVLGTNQVLPGLNVIPTAAANTAVWLGASTPVPGDHFYIFNNSGNAVRVKGAGAATINGATAGKYIQMANGDFMECWTAATTAQVCGGYGPGALPTPA